MSESEQYYIRSVQRVCDILELVQRRPNGLTLQEVTEATGLPKSSAFRYLATLESRGYVEKNAVGDFLVGISLRSERLDVLVQRCQPFLEKLRDHTGETVNFGMLQDGYVVYLAISESKRSIRNAPRSGEQEPIHSTALGKVLASAMTDDEVLTLLQRQGMPANTPNTITDKTAYLQEMNVVRSQGYAVDDRENEDDGRCVAVRITGTRLPIALSLSAPEGRLPPEDVPAIARELQSVANELQLLSFPDQQTPVTSKDKTS